MSDLAQILVTLGGLMLLGLGMDVLGRRIKLPRVSLLIVAGVLIGPEVFDLIPQVVQNWYEPLTNLALVMVGFLLGESLSRAKLREHGRLVLALSLSTVLVTFLLVFVGLVLFGVRADLALLLGAVATATAPAATTDVIHQVGARGPFTETLLGVVAIDDAWCIMLFSLVAALAHAIGGGSAADAMLAGARDLGGATLLGLALGVPMAFLTGRIRQGEPTQAEVLGFVLLCGGLSIWLEVSYLLAAVVMGATVANLARHHHRPFHAIEGIDWPFMILFFVLSGASLQLGALAAAGWIGLGYVALRTAGRVFGAALGTKAAGAPQVMRRWMGAALLPQAGVAIALALAAALEFPDLANVILPVALGATVVFEAISPVLTRLALSRAGEIESPVADTRD